MGTKPKTASLDQVTEAKEDNQCEYDDVFKENIILEHVADAIIIVNFKGNIIQVNQEVENYFGYTRDELIGQNIEKLIPKQVHHQHIKYRNDFWKSF